MLTIKNSHKNLLIYRIIIELLLVVGLSVFIWKLFNYSEPAIVKVTPNIVIKVQPQTISSNVLFLGNIYWGRYINDWSMASELKFQYPFSRLSEFDRSKYDAWVTGLECPVVAGVSMTSFEEDQTLTFNCSPDYLPEASKWFTAVTLGNNHTDNQGTDGFAETKQHLDDNGIQYFGHYDPRSIGDNCEVVSLPAKVQNDDQSIVEGYLPVAMCGFHGVFRIPSEDALAEMKAYSQYMPVIAMPHMGAEYRSEPDQLKIDFYRSLIDNGADMVIGDHPHWIQTSESYNGHLIIYSMGNFIFDQQDTAEVTRSAAINVLMTTNMIDSSELSKWIDLGSGCLSFKDDCLEKIKSQNLTKLDISYKFGIIGSNDSSKIVKPATDEQQASILDRLNWQSTINNLQPPYSSL